MTGVVVGRYRSELRDRLRRVAEKQGSDPDELESTPPPGWIVGTVEEAERAARRSTRGGRYRVMCQHLAHEDLEAIAVLGEALGPSSR